MLMIMMIMIVMEIIMIMTELQKRADRADQSVLIFLAGANFWEKHAKNCAFMSMAHSTYTIAH